MNNLLQCGISCSRSDPATNHTSGRIRTDADRHDVQRMGARSRGHRRRRRILSIRPEIHEDKHRELPSSPEDVLHDKL